MLPLIRRLYSEKVQQRSYWPLWSSASCMSLKLSAALKQHRIIYEAMALMLWPSPWPMALQCAAATFSRDHRGLMHIMILMSVVSM